jgi:hypothetical protein
MAPNIKTTFIIFTLVDVLVSTGQISLLFTLILQHNETAQKAIRYSVNQALNSGLNSNPELALIQV